MKRFKLPPLRSIISIFLFPLFAFAQDVEDLGTIVVTATKSETALRHVSTTTTVITREEILRRGHKTAVEALRDVVSFDINHSGGPGALSAPQMRGLTGRFMVVMIDGVRVNDPSDANGGVGTIFSHLTTEDIERIEVVRGPQSPLYGSNAAAGVINIITRSGTGDGEIKASYEAGSLNSQQISLGYNIRKERFKFRADQGITATNGVIALEKYRNYTTSLKIGYQKENNFIWETLIRYTRMNRNFAEFQENYSGKFWAVNIPDPNQKNEFDYTTVGNKLIHRIKDFWQHQFNFGISARERRTIDGSDGQLGTRIAVEDEFGWDGSPLYRKGDIVPVFDFGPADYSYRGVNYDFDYRHTFTTSAEYVSDILTAGFEYLSQNYKQKGTYGDMDGDISIASVYIHNQALFLDEALSLNSGLRRDDHDQAGGSTTGLLGLACDIASAGLILRANMGNAFRAPSIFELYSSAFGGNPDLKPEKSYTYEFGLEKYASNKMFTFMLATWHAEVDDAIVWAWTGPGSYEGKYMNIDRAQSDGVELGLRLNPGPNWIFGFNYTYTDSRKYSSASGTWSRNVQLPYNKFNLNATWLFRGASLSVDGYWVDDTRLRWNGLDKMESYFKLDLAGRIPQNKNFIWTFRATNLFNEDYYEGMAYREAGLCAFAGIELHY